MESINATTAEEITLNARDYEGRDDIYNLIQSAAKQGLSHVTVIINGKDEPKFIADMENKGFLYRRAYIYSTNYAKSYGTQFSLYKKSADNVVYNIGWIKDEWIKDDHE
jgi:uncharacterized radical SAM superfamily Fe-S cluster-containing enzyme